jgi:hypothetical protein
LGNELHYSTKGRGQDEIDGYFSSLLDDPPRRLLMMTAYVDESGHESANWMFIAGFLGSEDQWKDFVPKWKAALGPQRKSLHMNELRWNRECTKHLLARLGPVPQGSKLTPVFGGVKYGDYAELTAGTENEKPYTGIPFVFTRSWYSGVAWDGR